MADAVKKLFDDLLHPPELSRYADPYLANEEENTQLVPYHKDLAEGKNVLAADNLETHDDLFKNYKLTIWWTGSWCQDLGLQRLNQFYIIPNLWG